MIPSQWQKHRDGEQLVGFQDLRDGRVRGFYVQCVGSWCKFIKEKHDGELCGDEIVLYLDSSVVL